ncbi:MAG: multicopper oxidase domain-containing protein [Bryobacteraceae bacterium]
MDSNLSIDSQLTRRRMVSLGASLLSAAALGAAQSFRAIPATPADITVRISEIDLELGPKLAVKTRVYNGQAPGPLLRMTEGKTVAVDVVNETYEPEMVHWHGFFIPPDVPWCKAATVEDTCSRRNPSERAGIIPTPPPATI